MSLHLLSLTIHYEHDTVAARQRARQIAGLLGFNAQDQTRISTAVSEIARNAFNYAQGGRVEYLLEGLAPPQLFVVKIADSGPGIHDLDSILEGRYKSRTGMGLGIIGTRRIMDQVQIESVPGEGTTVWLKKLLPKRAPLVCERDLARIVATLQRERLQDAFHELQHQNQELLSAMEEIRTRGIELTRLNAELEDTNRGVVALYAELDEKADYLRRADELKSRFLSNMSHEFRSPLNSILALSGLLRDRVDGDLTPEQDQQVGFIRTAAQDLLELVNDLLDIAKVEAGKVDVKAVDFEPANLFAALRGMLRPLLLSHSVDLIFEDVSHIPAIYSDEAKVSQILRNFISNALKFTEQGEVRVSGALKDGGFVEFSVSDTGIGIAPENQSLIFEDFAQVDNPIQRRIKGTGLGLPLSRKLAVLLGGHVEVESRLGVGSTFSVRIPVRYRDPAGQYGVPAIEETAGETGLPVLIVEDSPEMMAVYQSLLKGSGYQAVPASTSREAEQLLEKIRPAAIVLDVLLRSEDTWALMARLKADGRTKNIPILVIAALEDQAKGYHLGVDEYLIKPVEPAAMIERLNSLTNRQLLRHIVIIDDDEKDRYLLKQHLKDVCAVVTEASTGEEGIRRVRDEMPEAVLLDLEMPDMTGFEVLRELKSEPSTMDVPVVICTSFVLSEAQYSQLMEQATAIVKKETLGRPDTAETLRRTLKGVERRLPAV
jgi:signal transduction histidine kinase/DNA-binding response OmpR family regulator